jgi:hypothetical protein
MKTPASKTERRQRMVHFVTAGVLILKGISKLEHPEGFEVVIPLAVAAGVIVFVVTLFHHAVAARLRRAESPIYLLESLVCLAMGNAEWRHGTWGLHFVWLAAGLLFFGASVRTWLSARSGPGGLPVRPASPIADARPAPPDGQGSEVMNASQEING